MTNQNTSDAARIRDRYGATVEAVRARTDLTPAGKASRITDAYQSVKNDMGALQQTAQADRAAEQARLERSLFSAPGQGTDASAVVSYRDALDRAEAVTNSKDAAALLARAERSNDEPLARAVASVSYDRLDALGDPGYGDVLNTYAATRPAAARDLSALIAVSDAGSTAAAAFEYMIMPPVETQAGSGQWDNTPAAPGSWRH